MRIPLPKRKKCSNLKKQSYGLSILVYFHRDFLGEGNFEDCDFEKKNMNYYHFSQMVKKVDVCSGKDGNLNSFSKFTLYVSVVMKL